MQKDTTAAPREAILPLRLWRVIDGDSIEAWVELPLSCSLQKRIRLKGFYAPELNGATPTQALAAAQRLKEALDRTNPAIMVRGSREDLHGRLVATLILGGIAANPHEVLGPYQLSERDHAADLRAAKQNKAQGKQALRPCPDCGGSATETAFGSPAKYPCTSCNGKGVLL